MGMVVSCNPEDYLDTALDALSTVAEWRAILDELPVPIYTTDTKGAVTYWNRACVEFAGREPKLGRDRWCVTWKIYTTTGEFMPHDQCPMADAIRRRRVVRDGIAIAERPDGSRVAFRPYPTPLFDEHGNLTGAVNMLIDVTDQQAQALADQAERCRRLADAMYDRDTTKVLSSMAEEFERTAQGLGNKP
ncbi:MAG: PAS domain S-box protein [Sphingomicrobium sp.]